MILVPANPSTNELASSSVTKSPVKDAGTDNTVQTSGDHLSRLDSDMFEILKSKNFSDEREKCKNYLQVLRRYLFFKENERLDDKDSAPEIDEIQATLAPPSEEDILESVPKIYTKRARMLLRHWRTFDSERLKWNSAGNVIIDGKLVPQSNITELLNHVVKKKKKDEEEEPAGRFQFAKFIGSTDTPNNLIGNVDILKIAKRLTEPSKTAKRQIQEPIASPPLTRQAAKKKWLRLDI